MTLDVQTWQRNYHQDTTLQRALSSLFGLICALSDCPHTRFLRPMASFHLPLSSDTETLVRTASLYLLQRYIRNRQQPEQSISLDGECALRCTQWALFYREAAQRGDPMRRSMR